MLYCESLDNKAKPYIMIWWPAGALSLQQLADCIPGLRSSKEGSELRFESMLAFVGLWDWTSYRVLLLALILFCTVSSRVSHFCYAS